MDRSSSIFNFNPKSEKIKLLIVLSLFFPLAAGLPLFTFMVDPANLFRKRYENIVADLFISGENVTNMNNLDERLIQKCYIQKLARANDVVVLGSSRAMGLSKAMILWKQGLDNVLFFNNSISGASLEDFIAIYALYAKKEMAPKVVFIGLDPWILNVNNRLSGRWTSLSESYNDGLEIIGLGSEKVEARGDFVDRLFLLTDPRYFQMAQSVFVRRLCGKKIRYHGPARTDLADGEEGEIRRSDGSVSYRKASREISRRDVEKLASDYISGGDVYRLERFFDLDDGLKMRFERFILHLKREGARVVFFFPPYHPSVYRFIHSDARYRNVDAAQKYFTEFARREGVEYFSSYNPEDIPCDGGDFYDGMHSKPSCHQKMQKR